MSSAPAVPALDNTFGALYLSSVITMGLWGAGTVQLYYYFNKYVKDAWWLKLHVALVWAVDTAHQALVIHSVYIYLIKEYGNPAYLAHLERSLLDSIILTGFICAQVQVIFIMRIWRLSNKNIALTSIVTLLVIAQFTSTCVYYGRAYHFTEFAELETIFTITRTINILTALADASVAGVLITLLHKSRTGFRKSETMINRLILFTVNTGLITGLCAITSLITGIVLPNTFVYIFFYLCISRLYVNSLFATLNSRESMRSGVHDQSPSVSNGLSLTTFNARTGSVRQKDSNPCVVNISVDTETVTVNDSDDRKERMSSDGRSRSEQDIEAMLPSKN
ncbi:hypothetical protein DFH11DRAFT_1547710 [Phellopilus nigrolimitatus]|nr:hypothetical protein DFH11DRAFT_1547710 [Phellopilus nigrolimitatus]